MIVAEPGAMHTAEVIVRLLSRCGHKAHLIKETHCNSLEVLIQPRAKPKRDMKADKMIMARMPRVNPEARECQESY